MILRCLRNRPLSSLEQKLGAEKENQTMESHVRKLARASGREGLLADYQIDWDSGTLGPIPPQQLLMGQSREASIDAGEALPPVTVALKDHD